jgi:hypothetical protein
MIAIDKIRKIMNDFSNITENVDFMLYLLASLTVLFKRKECKVLGQLCSGFTSEMNRAVQKYLYVCVLRIKKNEISHDPLRHNVTNWFNQ